LKHNECPPSKQIRKKLRLENYDYRSPGAYFVTICTQGHQPILGKIFNQNVELTWKGKIVHDLWEEIPQHFSIVKLDEFVVMPNHVHGIIWIVEQNTSMPHPQEKFSSLNPQIGSLGVIVRSFKSAVTRKVNQNSHTPGVRFWQRSFHDHILRNDNDLDHHRKYILENPIRWKLDEYYR
jgi:REP element-mobilizing transposase RayT